MVLTQFPAGVLEIQIVFIRRSLPTIDEANFLLVKGQKTACGLCATGIRKIMIIWNKPFYPPMADLPALVSS